MLLHKKPESDLAIPGKIGDDVDQRFGGSFAKLDVATLTQGRGGTGASTPELVAAPRAEQTREPLHFRTRFLKALPPELATPGLTGEVAYEPVEPTTARKVASRLSKLC